METHYSLYSLSEVIPATYHCYTVKTNHQHIHNHTSPKQNSYMLMKFLSVLLAVQVTLAQQAGHDDATVHDSHAWKWAGVFDFHLYATATMFLSVGSGGSYSHKSIDVLILRTTGTDASGIEAVEDAAERLFKTTSAFVPVTSHEDRTVLPGVVHTLEVDSKSAITSFRLGGFEEDAKQQAVYVLFTQYAPSEVEGHAGHYLKSKKGQDIEPTATEPAAAVAVPAPAATPNSEASQHAGQAIGASVIVTLCGAIGLIVVYPCCNLSEKNAVFIGWGTEIAQTFAAGALLSTSFFLIFPESLHHLKKAHPTDDVLQTVAFGGTTLAGIVVSMLISMICSLYGQPSTEASGSTQNINNIKQMEMTSATGTATATATATDTASTKNEYVVDVTDGSNIMTATNKDRTALSGRSFCQFRPKQWTGAAWTVLVGDFFHNVADGIAIGVAFRTCDPSFGWIVTIGAIGHEVSQEVADFCLLITRGNMSVGSAVVANLLSGVSCIIGAVVASYVSMSEEAVGGLLGFSGGVYVWAAVCECLAPLAEDTKSMKAILLRVTMFVVGAVCIGLVLLNHVHCEAAVVPSGPAAAAADPHAGHNH